jgi:hypothetical protein
LQDAKGRGVIPVQLALFSDMIQSRPWEPSMLEQVGGTSGGVGNFLDESFSPSNPQCLVHEEDARKLLGALLPVAGSDLKGGRKSLEELQELSGYRGKPTEFRGLCGILEGRLRLIKPSEDQDPSYQLTHDYLVGPLREWLTRKRRETRRGRAELALAECAEVWSIRKESKQLPTMFEWLKIRWHTRVNDWTAPQRAMMKYADRQQWTRLATAGALGAVLLAGGLWYRAYSTVKQLELVDFVRLPTMLEDISSRWDRILLRPGISDRITQSKVPMSKESMSNEPIGQEELKYRLAKLSLDRSDKDNIAVLGKALTTADASQVGIIIKQLEPVREELLESLWVEARRNRADTLLRCASALAKYRPEDQRWDEISKNVTAAVVQENLLDLKHWSNLLTGSRDKLIPHLVSIYKDTGQPRVETEVAASTVLLAEFLDRPRDFQMLHDLMMTGHSDQLAKLFGRYSQFESMAIEELRKELSKAAPTRPADPSDGTSDRTEFVRWQTNKVEHFRRQANAAVSLMKFSRTDSVEDLQKFLTVTDDPEAISQFVHRARGSKIAIETMMLHFNSELARESQESLASNSVERQQHYLRLYAFILALGDYPVSDRNQVEPGKLKGLVDQMHSKYREHPSRAVHSALSWTLRQWGFNDAVKAVDETEIPFDETLRREWFTTKVQLIKSDDGKNTDGEKVNEDYEAALFEPIYFTFLVFGPGEYRMGQSGRRQVRLNKAFALCDREVDWRKFYTMYTFPVQTRPREFLNKPNYPVEVTREFAVQFCVNTTYWGSKSKGHDDSKKDPVDLDYRLPTEAEWEFATRSGSVTPFSFGSDEELVVDYSWCRANARGQTWQVATLRPTISGLFDSHGNLHEYTLDYYHEFAEESSFSEDPVYNKKEDSEVPALRGGSFHQLPMYCSSYQRYFDPPAVKEKLNGVRLAIRFETKGD